jgi:hypothetical protein
MRTQTPAETPASVQLSCAVNIDENNHAQHSADFSQLLLRTKNFHDFEIFAAVDNWPASVGTST